MYPCINTHMNSAKMSMVGTSSWISPELIKNEACTEKVDVWSFGVVAWEILTQEVPFKGLNSMSILFGVGSGNLRLHLCFSPRARNRPTFSSILKHLANLAVEIDAITEDAWAMRRQVWQKEVNKEAEKLPGKDNGNDDPKQLSQEQGRRARSQADARAPTRRRAPPNVPPQDDEQTVIKNELVRFKQELEMRAAAIAEQEAQMRRAGTAGPPNGHSPPAVHKHSSGSVPELKAVRLQKTLNLEAPLPNTPAGSTPNLQHRRVTAVCSLSSSDDERFSAIPPRSRHSYAASSRQESFEDGRGFSSGSRAASARSSIAHRHLSGVRNASACNLPAGDEDFPMVCPCCSYNFAFQRSSAARVSGISADSGVVSAATDGRHHSALMLDVEENGNHSACGLTADVPLYRNHAARWSDGRIAHRHHAHRHPSTAPNSATRQRTAPLRAEHEAASRAGSSRIHRSHSVHSRTDVRSAPTDLTGEEADVPMQMDTSMEASVRYPRRTVDETIAELSSSVSSKSNRSAKKAPHLAGIGMDQSSSTMASSLERSLEAALVDGLSDKESKLRTLTSSFPHSSAMCIEPDLHRGPQPECRPGDRGDEHGERSGARPMLIAAWL
ncbi:Protein kinase domain-containing protein [Aphelenchoides fujianensis]|nr:Protein kinase domain-containing protein [Aphelenchoides fujianensis]